MFRVDLDTLYGTKYNALGLIVVPNALGTKIRVDFVNVFAHVDGRIGALGLTHVAVDAFFSNI